MEFGVNKQALPDESSEYRLRFRQAVPSRLLIDRKLPLNAPPRATTENGFIARRCSPIK